MACDGLLPSTFSTLHPKFRTPWKTTLLTGVICALLAGIFPIQILGELTSIGTLFAFFLVCIGVMILRKQKPDLPRRFRVPFGPYLIPLTGASLTAMLIFTSSPHTILRLFIWMAIGMIIYAFYGYKKSKLRHGGLPLKATDSNNASQDEIVYHQRLDDSIIEEHELQMMDDLGPKHRHASPGL